MSDETDNESDIMDELGFCGCGMPVDATEYVLAVLEHIDRLKTHVWEKALTWEQWNAEGDTIFTNDGAAYFAYYVMAEKGLTEHGGSVPGWLSEKGYAMVARIKEWQVNERP